MSEQKQPLWQAMDDGMDVQASKETGQAPLLIWRRIRASEIRALRDWLVPEEDKPNDEFCCPPVDTMLWRQKMDLRALLTAEANRAERGDQPTIQEH